jgi:uncharacterized membrane protein YkoI
MRSVLRQNDERMLMTDKLKNTLLVIATMTSLALGGAALAGAASSGNSSSSGTDAAASTGTAPAGLPRQRSDETLLTGDTESKVTAAALAKLPGGTIERVETDADGHAKYEAHMLKADGTRATVYVNESFEAVSVESR